jgi:hypothetical protein
MLLRFDEVGNPSVVLFLIFLRNGPHIHGLGALGGMGVDVKVSA